VLAYFFHAKNRINVNSTLRIDRTAGRHSVIIPMVLQIGETIVLQRVELEEKASSLHFWIFGS
jgi:hypothetical protein